MEQQTLVLVAVIAILLLVIFCNGPQETLDGFKQRILPQIAPKQEHFSQPAQQDEAPMEEEAVPKEDVKFDDSDTVAQCSQGYLASVTKKDKTMFGTTSNSRRVNFGLGIDKHIKSDSYNSIILNEIGQNTVDSQKKYCNYLMNDSNLRYLDTEIETDYIQTQGISLSRRSNPQVAWMDGTQQVGLDSTQYRQTGSISDFGSLRI